MAEEKLRWSVYEHPQEGFCAVRARHVDVPALLLGPIWAYLRGLWLLGAGLSLMELAAVAALIFWG